MEMKPENSENRRHINKSIAILISAILIVCIGVAAYFGYRLVQHENNQKNAIVHLQNQLADKNEEIVNLEDQIMIQKDQLADLGDQIVNQQNLSNNLQDQITNQQKELEERRLQLLVLNNRIASINEGPFQWSETGFNYLTIGNSITRHGLAEYWWNAVGMAASDEDHDYFHLFMDYLETRHDRVVGGICGLAVWESLSANRSDALPLLDPYLSGDLDLITVQLGENVSDLTTFEGDFEDLLRYIINHAPNADIIVVGDFWESGERDSYKKQAAENCGVVYVPLEGIKSNPEYYCGLGTVVYDADGGAHVVDHEGVAAHPGDNGMQAIADLIIAAYNEMDNE